ncbi:MAG: hypothetical protein ACRBN8_44675 [Nannocystales bacterium]
MADRTRIEVYEWPEGTERSTEVSIDVIEGDPVVPIPTTGDVILLPAPTAQVRSHEVDEDEFFIMRGLGKPYRVVGRELMFSPRSSSTEDDTPSSFSRAWIFVRAMTKDEYWGSEP